MLSALSFFTFMARMRMPANSSGASVRFTPRGRSSSMSLNTTMVRCPAPVSFKYSEASIIAPRMSVCLERWRFAAKWSIWVANASFCAFAFEGRTSSVIPPSTFAFL